MYAVIKTGGKQYRVAIGDKIKIEQITANVGQELVIDQVLAINNGDALVVGAPLVAGATVTAKVLAHGRHDKVHIFKMRRRKHYQKRQGHRQAFTELEIAGFAGPGINLSSQSTQSDQPQAVDQSPPAQQQQSTTTE
jgi:large subunit ribosomal protein L21